MMHDVSVVWYDRPGPGKFLTASQVSLMAGFKIPVQLTIRVLSDNTQAWKKKIKTRYILGPIQVHNWLIWVIKPG